MRITSIETLWLNEFSNVLWVLIHTDEGVTGLGETFFGSKAVEAFIHETAALKLIGEDPLLIDRAWYAIYHWQRLSGGQLTDRVLTAVDLALWDLMGKVTGQPVWKLLGAARPKIVGERRGIAGRGIAGRRHRSRTARAAGAGTPGSRAGRCRGREAAWNRD